MEEIESQILAATASAGGVDSARAMHAWAARELQMLSDSIRRDSTEVELKTARKVPEERPTADPIIILQDIHVSKSERIIPSKTQQSLEFQDNSVSGKSSARSLPPSSKNSDISGKSSTRSCPSSSNNTDLSLSSEDSVFRSASPLPYSAELHESSQNTRPCTALSSSSKKVLDEYIHKCEIAKKEKRNLLRLHALSLLVENDQNDIDQSKPPPLAKVEKTSKGGVALNIDLSGFRFA